MRHTSLHVSHKHSHGCHCTTGDIIVFQACTALTWLKLSECRKLTGKAKETSHPYIPDFHRFFDTNYTFPETMLSL